MNKLLITGSNGFVGSYFINKYKYDIKTFSFLKDDINNFDFKVSIIRTPIIYGHGVKANIKNLVNLVNKVPILPFGNIPNKRSMVYIGNLCHLVDVVITQKQNGVFLASDDEPLSTSKLIELISKNLDKKVYLIKIPFFESLLKTLKPSFHKRLYGSLEVDNTITKEKLNLKNPYSVEDGIRLMIKGENI
jgi:UDP-glucose 4-epimerase